MKVGSLSLIALFFLLINPVYGQVNEVYDRLTNAYEYSLKSKEYATASLDLIRKCYALSTVEEIREYAGKAKDEMDNAKIHLNFAINHAAGAEEKADDLDCHNAEIQADQAESNLFTARNRFEDAFAYSSKAQTASTKADFAVSLGKARGYTEEGVSYIEDALKELNKAIEDLKNCPNSI